LEFGISGQICLEKYEKEEVDFVSAICAKGLQQRITKDSHKKYRKLGSQILQKK
jgi:hypothetical protein